MTLYELAEQYQRLMEFAEDPSTDAEVFKDTMDALGGEIDEKAENYGKVIRTLEGEVLSIADEEDRLARRRRAIQNNIDRMKEHLQNAMIACNKPKIKTDLFSFGIQKNAPAVVLDSENIPSEYLIPQEPKIDKMRIKNELKAGADLPFAHLEQSESLRIR